MPLNTVQLQQRLEQLHDQMVLLTDPVAAKALHTTQLALIITEFVKTGTVTVTTTGTAVSQTGIGTIS
jgi:hypothetical protein